MAGRGLEHDSGAEARTIGETIRAAMHFVRAHTAFDVRHDHLSLAAFPPLALRWAVLDLEEGTLAVRESVFEGKFQPTKTLKAVRTIPLGRHAVAALKVHREHVTRTAPENLVFGNRSGKPLRESKLLRNVLQPAAERAGLGRVTWHQFATFTRRCSTISACR